jgi:hypothetical protein
MLDHGGRGSARSAGGAVIPPARWAARLQEFTDRNASRRTVIEIDDPAIGAQDLEADYPLRGVAYDPRDGRIEIMLGDLGDPASHMTHSIEEVSELAVFEATDGRDELLRIAHPGGQTLLRISDYRRTAD